jgi:hypothetical protein
MGTPQHSQLPQRARELLVGCALLLMPVLSGYTSTRSYFASGLPHAGWTQAPRLPYDGAYQASCGDPYCWKKDHAPRYVSLESVTSHGGGVVTYHIRLAVPPNEPSSTPDSVGIYATRTYDTRQQSRLSSPTADKGWNWQLRR